MQSRKHSVIETVFGTTIGFAVAFVTQMIVFPLFGIHTEVHDNISIGLIFTAVSILRGYAVRRLFNWISTNRGRNA